MIVDFGGRKGRVVVKYFHNDSLYSVSTKLSESDVHVALRHFIACILERKCACGAKIIVPKAQI